jgi:hypothetical protein
MFAVETVFFADAPVGFASYRLKLPPSRTSSFDPSDDIV